MVAKLGDDPWHELRWFLLSNLCLLFSCVRLGWTYGIEQGWCDRLCSFWCEVIEIGCGLPVFTLVADFIHPSGCWYFWRWRTREEVNKRNGTRRWWNSVRHCSEGYIWTSCSLPIHAQVLTGKCVFRLFWSLVCLLLCFWIVAASGCSILSVEVGAPILILLELRMWSVFEIKM